MTNKVVYKDRKNTHSRKWDGCKEQFGAGDLLPLWIADMDFEAPECVKKALKEYIDFGVFGYYTPQQGYYDAFINWEKRYHNYQVKQEWIRFAPGVVPAINWLLHILTEENDGYLARLRITVGNAFGYQAVQSAYENGREWLEEVLETIEDNYWYMKSQLETALPEVWIPQLQGTYLMWIDLKAYVPSHRMEKVIQEECGLGVDYGTWFGGEESVCCIRVNLATKRENIELAAQRIIQALKR